MISSYKAAQLHMEKARKKANGRPMKGTGWRLYQDGDEYTVVLYGAQIGRFLPDNTFMFTLTGERARPVAHTLSAVIHRNLPFYWARVGAGKYRVDHRENTPTPYPWQHFNKPTNAPMLYDGLKFDLSTGRCLNYQPDPQRKIDDAARLVWLRALRQWKRQLRTLVRLGAADQLLREHVTAPLIAADWLRDTEYLDKLYMAIKDGDCSTGVVRMVIKAEVSRFATGVTGDEFYQTVQDALNRHSIELRKRFGVIIGEG